MESAQFGSNDSAPALIKAVVLPYAAFACMWWMLSLWWMAGHYPNNWLTSHQFLVFVFVSAGLLYYLTTKAWTRFLAEQQRLHQSEARLRLLVDNLPDSYVYQYTKLPDGAQRFLYISDGVERLHGVSAESVLNDASTLLSRISPEMLPALQQAESRSRQSFSDFSIEVLVSGRDGVQRWMLLCSRPQRDGDGRVLWNGVATDVTERKHAEMRHQEIEQRLADIIEFLPDATFVIDEHRQLVAWNRACEMLTGVKKMLLIGRGDYAYGEPFFGTPRPILIDLLLQPSPELESTYKYIERREGFISGETFAPHLYGGKGAHLQGIAAPLFNQTGKCIGAIEVVRDVTEQRRTQMALRDSEQKYRELVELANSIILRWNAEGIITFVNEYGLKFFGYTAEELRNRHVIGTIVPFTESGGRDLRGLMQRICADPAAFEQNVNENMLRSGERVWISWTNKVVMDTHGQVLEILSIGTDITERKRSEEQVRRLNDDLRKHADELEHRVDERTRELAIARDRAEAADRLKSAFLATMSHELRTPLNSIIGFTGILLQGLAGPLNDEQSKQLGMVRGSARHLLDLINDVLDISKIEAGQLEVASQYFDISESVAKSINIVKPMAEKKALQLQVEYKMPLKQWRSDQRRVEQILINLLNNAVKFTEKGYVRVLVRAQNNVLYLSVADSGIGIKDADVEALFRPFQQIDSGLARKHEGTGLGLAICQRLAELLGGRVEVKSIWGEGSIFTLILPFAAEKAA